MEAFKINILEYDKIKEIHVLYKENLQDIFESDRKNEKLEGIFTDDELEFIDSANIKVRFHNVKIYLDDTIETIKKKICYVLDKKVSIEELYLFGLFRETLTPSTVFNNITNNGNITLTQTRLFQHLLNINGLDIDTLEKKEIYYYSDIKDLNFNDVEELKICLTHKLVTNTGNILFTVNPFDVIEYDENMIYFIDNILSTLNKVILLDFGTFIGNNIYVVTADKVLEHYKDRPVEFITSTMKLYYPFLYKQGIESLKQLKEKQLQLQESTTNILSTAFIKNMVIQDMIQNIYIENKEYISLNNDGFRSIEFMINPKINYKLPLNAIFKYLKTKESIPMTKLISSIKEDKLLRIYAPNHNTNGKKIPYLSKANIMKFIKITNKETSLNILNIFNGGQYIIEIKKNGVVYVNMMFKSLMSISILEEQIKDNVNILLNSINDYIEPLGLNVELFREFDNELIDVIDMNYTFATSIKNTIHLSNYKNCLYNVFNIQSNDLKKGINMTYKLVSNYDNMDAIDAKIILLLNKGYNLSSIKSELLSIFDIEETELQKIILSKIEDVQMDRLGGQRQMKIKNNPGFTIQIKQESFANKISVEFGEVNNLKYIDILKKYIFFILSITQNENVKKYFSTIKEMCEKGGNEENKDTDLVSQTEESYLKNKPFSGANLDLEFDMKDEENNEDDLLDFFGFDEDEEEDEDEDEEEDFNGGSLSDIELDESLDLEDDNFEIMGDIELDDTPEEEKSLVQSIQEQANEAQKQATIAITKQASNIQKQVDDVQKQATSAVTKQASAIQKEVDDAQKRATSAVTKQASAIQKEVGKRQKQATTAVTKQASAIQEQVDDAQKQATSAVREQAYDVQEQLDDAQKQATNAVREQAYDVQEQVDDAQKQATSGVQTTLSNMGLLIDEKEKDEDELKEVERMDREMGVNEIQNIEGNALKGNDFFIHKRFMEHVPELFVKKGAEYNVYSRSCQANANRQPVVITDEEKKMIDQYHPGSYTNSIEYNKNNNKYHYICPRYWCLKTNRSLTKKQIDEGECGGPDAIIPFGVKKVPKGKAIYQFFSPQEHLDKNSKYIEHHPGFLLKGDCLPCCFKKWDSAAQIQKRKDCLGNNKKERKGVKYEDIDEYIKGSEKFPLEENRWGYLPLSMELFLNVKNRSFMIDTKNKKPKPFVDCVLRHGVENHPAQSFVACIADVYVNILGIKRIPSIIQMKEFIKDAINLDLFLKYNNGNLVKKFSKNRNSSESIKIEDYRSTNMYKMALNGSLKMNYFKEVINAYINFNTYLSDDEIEIDYKYLWDIICTPNIKLFTNGLNLVILEIPEDDSTDNVELICPTSIHSNMLFDEKKPCIIMIKRDKYYEPIYIYKDVQKQIEIKKQFKVDDDDLLSNIRIVLNKVKEYTNNYCVISKTMKVNEYETNISGGELLELLRSIDGLQIKKQVMNFNNKIIGFEVLYNELEGYLPCYPSGLLEDIDISFINEVKWQSYNKTIDFLIEIKTENAKILCNPRNKVESDGLIVGILTETNQFIEIDPPERNNEPDYPIILQSNYIIADSNTLNNNKIDEERANYIKTLNLQDNYYNVFRNVLKITLNNIENRLFKNEILELIDSRDILYFEKINLVVEKIKKIMSPLLDFVEYDAEILNSIDRVTLCNEACDKPYCIKTEGENCKLLIPKNNLVKPSIENENFFYEKLADELIRFNRIKVYIFDETLYLSYENTAYNIGADEILIYQSELSHELFENMNMKKKNRYVYEDGIEVIKNNNIKDLNKSKKIILKVKSGCKQKKKLTHKWKELFPSGFNEAIYKKELNCGFDMVIDILKNQGIKESIVNLKKILSSEYTETYKIYLTKIKDILHTEGKKKQMKRIQKKEITFQEVINSADYFLTILDLWILAIFYKIPILLVSSKKMNYGDGMYEILYKNEDNNNFYIIKPSSMSYIGRDKTSLYPEYSLILNKEEESSINISNLTGELYDNFSRLYEKEQPEDDALLVSFLNSYRLKNRKLVLKNL